VLKGIKGEGSGRRSLKPIPFPDANEKWILARSKHFVFVSSAGERKTRDIAAGLETLAAALMQLSPRFSAAPAETRVFIFSRHREAQPYFAMLIGRPDAHVNGVFVSSNNSGSMLMESGFGWGNDRTPFHELIHYLVSNSGSRPPLWLEEGLAEYFSNAELRNGSIRAGAPLATHVQVLQQRAHIPLAKIFSISTESDLYNAADSQRAFYAESWALVEWLIRTNPTAFYDFLREVQEGKTVEEAFPARYHRPIDDMQRAFDARFGPTLGTVLPVPNADTTVTTTPLDRADLLYRLGKFLSHVEDGGIDAERHFREALVVNPAHARSLAALGEYDKAIAADPNDPEIYLDYAESLLGKQIGPLAGAEETTSDDQKSFRKARELAQKATALAPNDARAWGDLGTSYIVESDVTDGIAALEKARDLAPGRLDYAVHLFALYRRTGNRAKADPLFATLDRARNPQVSYALRATSLRVDLARANALVQQQKLDEAAAVIRELAANTEDLDARKDLAHQADEIAHAAATNRQIDVYNKAVAEVNRGEYAKAMKTLDQLLAGATDPDVIRDAKKLQKQLAARRRS
jgi:tetratricopeptide (TPR) repeat protein